jgi:SAM-dependent methyltransferase
VKGQNASLRVVGAHDLFSNVETMFLFNFIYVYAFLLPSVGKWNTLDTAPFHPAIHTFGNTGFGGRLHAAMATFATDLIDRMAYNNRIMREEVSTELKLSVGNDTTIIEVGCGVGTLTTELAKCDFRAIVAVDTSQEMLDRAVTYVKNGSVKFACKNGKYVQSMVDADVAIASMVFHELPPIAHDELIRSMHSAVSKSPKKQIWIIDIAPEYTPSVMMRMGEPYLMSYLKTVDSTLDRLSIELSMKLTRFELINNRVRVWVLSEVSYEPSSTVFKNSLISGLGRIDRRRLV